LFGFNFQPKADGFMDVRQGLIAGYALGVATREDVIKKSRSFHALLRGFQEPTRATATAGDTAAKRPERLRKAAHAGETEGQKLEQMGLGF
jgi:hypothetical protein